MNQIALFLRIYIRPLRAFGPVIDEARLAFAVGIALLAVFAVQAPRYAEYRKVTEQALRYVRAHPAPPRAGRGRRIFGQPGPRGDSWGAEANKELQSEMKRRVARTQNPVHPA